MRKLFHAFNYIFELLPESIADSGLFRLIRCPTSTPIDSDYVMNNLQPSKCNLFDV